MKEAVLFLSEHGALVLFIAVFVEQLGVPVPATPFLLVAGGLIGSHRLEWLPCLSAGVMGSLLADLIWFQIGVKTGYRAVKFVCRISLEPDSCVRRTQDLLTRHGIAGLIFGKFIPGLSTLLPPLAGSSGMRMSRFAAVDFSSSALYCGSLLLVGVLFSDKIEQILGLLERLGSGAVVLVGSLIGGWLLFKWYQRHRLLRELQIMRITVEDLRQRQEVGDKPYILDLRPATERASDPWLIPGAVLMTVEELEARLLEIPRDRDVVLYCSCPNEVTSAKMAIHLKGRGILRARPLQGGLDAWRARQFPVAPTPLTDTSREVKASALGT